MELKSIGVARIMFTEDDIQKVKLSSGRTAYRIGPLFAAGSIAEALLERVGQAVEVAVRWTVRQGNSRAFLNGTIVEILDVEPAEEEQEEEPEKVEQTKTTKTKKAAPLARKLRG